MINRLTEYIIVRKFQGFPQVILIISRVKNEYQCQFTIDVDCSRVTIRFSWYLMKDDVDTILNIHSWNFPPNFIPVEYNTL